MRAFAKALPCLLFCVACVILTPTAASAHTQSPSLLSGSNATATPAQGLRSGLRVDEGLQVARRRAKAPKAAPKVVKAEPRDPSNRFLMTQNGKQMTADDFEAWMKSRGIRVAKGAPEAPKAAE